MNIDIDIDGLREALKDYYDAHPTDDNGQALSEWAETLLGQIYE